MKIFSGSSNPTLSKSMCFYLKVPEGRIILKSFSDGESYCQILENVRGQDVYLVQSISPPANHNLMELLIMIDAAKRASASRITAVIPYYGYARQDRKDKPRVPITAKLVADLLTAAGAQRILTMDLHAAQIQGFFNIPHDHLFATPVFLDYLSKQKFENLTIVSPDAGGVERARAWGKKLKAGLVIIDKRTEEANVAEVMNVIGEVEGRTALIADDLIDTAGTLTKAAGALMEKGAKEVLAGCTHPVLSGKAVENIMNSPLKTVLVSDTIPLRNEAKESGKIKVLSVVSLLAEAVKRIHENSSVTSLFI